MWNRARQTHAEAAQAYQDELEERSAAAEQRLFSVPPSMRGELRHCYDDVRDRTEYLLHSGDAEDLERHRHEMERLWERATRTNDLPLQHAVGQLAAERGDVALRDLYFRESKKTEAWERYVAAREKADSLKSVEGQVRAALTQNLSLREPEGLE
jgi:hypothetical protein